MTNQTSTPAPMTNEQKIAAVVDIASRYNTASRASGLAMHARWDAISAHGRDSAEAAAATAAFAEAEEPTNLIREEWRALAKAIGTLTLPTKIQHTVREVEVTATGWVPGHLASVAPVALIRTRTGTKLWPAHTRYYVEGQQIKQSDSYARLNRNTYYAAAWNDATVSDEVISKHNSALVR